MLPKARVAVFGQLLEIQLALAEATGLEVVLQGKEPFLWQETMDRHPLPAEIFIVDARLFPQVWSQPFPPEVAVAALGEGDSPSPLWEGQHGRRRFFPLPVDPYDVVAWAQWLFPVTGRVLAPKRPSGGHVVAVTGAKGGVGKTSLACHVGMHLSREGLQTILLDLDLPASDAGLFLGMEGGPSVLELLGQMDLFERGGWLERGRHGSGLYLVRGTGRPDLAQMVERKDVVEMVGWAARHFERVVLDIPSHLSDDLFYQLLELSHLLLLVTTPDAMALQRSALLLNLLAQMELPPGGEIHVVVNRLRPGAPGKEIVRHLLGRAPAAEIPEDPRSLDAGPGNQSLLLGRGRRNPWQEAVAGLVRPLVKTPVSPVKQPSLWEEIRRRWWR